MTQQDKDKFLEDLILSGAIEFAGIDLETGEMLYNFTDKLKDVNPQMYESSMTAFYHEMRELWAMGFIKMDITEENPLVTITEKALDDDAVAALPADLGHTIRYIKNILKRQ